MKKFTFRIPQPLFRQLHAHLFPGDHDEHGAVIAAGICTTHRGVRLLARELFLAKDGVDYVEGQHGYRALTSDFVLRVSDHCARHNLCYFAVHCHGGDDEVAFSRDDLASHRRGYPALLDITNGGPVGALVFARNAVAGSVWTREGVFSLEEVVVVGPNIARLRSEPPSEAPLHDETYHRQSLIFGAKGQRILAQSKIGVIGLGGAGSLINEWVARLGVGEIVAVDFDRIEMTNVPRVVGATKWDDPASWLPLAWPGLRRLVSRFATLKVRVARRVAKQANPNVTYTAIAGDVTDPRVAHALKDCDYLFLCADTHQSRLVFNALVHQYLIPGVQIGVKIPVDPVTGEIGDIFAVSRLVLPYSSGGCLWCNELISPVRLQIEALSPEERRRQAYVDDAQVTAPSVITLNALAAAGAANDFLMGYFGLFQDAAAKGFPMVYTRVRKCIQVDLRADIDCPSCSADRASSFAKGDAVRLPCRCQ